VRAGAIQRELSDAIEIIRERYNEVAAKGMAAVNAAAAANDAGEGARLRDISKKMTKLAKRVERAKALTTKADMEQALESIYTQLEWNKRWSPFTLNSNASRTKSDGLHPRLHDEEESHGHRPHGSGCERMASHNRFCDALGI
jgi:hypothetical protein